MLKEYLTVKMSDHSETLKALDQIERSFKYIEKLKKTFEHNVPEMSEEESDLLQNLVSKIIKSD